MLKNNLALFSGTILNVEVSHRKTEFGARKHQTVVLECIDSAEKDAEKAKKLYYLRSWGEKTFEVGQEVHLLTNVEYRRVTSKKAQTRDAQGNLVAFEYGAFDFTIIKQMNNAELVEWHKEQIKNYE